MRMVNLALCIQACRKHCNVNLRLMGCMWTALQTEHASRSTIFFVVLACGFRV